MGGLREQAGADPKAKRMPMPIGSTRMQWVAKGGDVPEASIAWKVENVQGRVILHEGSGSVWGVGPVPQMGDKMVAGAAK